MFFIYIIVSFIVYISFYSFVGVINVLTSTSRMFATSMNCCMDGCTLLAHHRDTVFSVLPSCSANHRFVFPFSANTAFSLFSITTCWLFDIENWLFCCKYTNNIWKYYDSIHKLHIIKNNYSFLFYCHHFTTVFRKRDHF